MRATWYVLEDGRPADPAECSMDDEGILRHTSGSAVAKRSADAYASRGVDLEDDGKLIGREIKPEEPKRGYKTREAKAK